MTEWIWFNGEIVPMADASVGVEDRGFQFADGVYEVIKLYDGKPFTLTEHLARLWRSAAGVAIVPPISADVLAVEIHKLIAKQNLPGDGMVYLQLTRGVSPRNHQFPAQPKPTLLFYARPLPALPPVGAGPGVGLMTVPDERWKKCWIKSIALVANVLAKNQALAAGFDEAVFVDDGNINECSASNFFAVIGGRLITHPVGPKVLPGITRDVLLACAKEIGVEVEERPMTESEAAGADEMFITSTTREISWVSRWNERTVASECGPVTRRLHDALRERVRSAGVSPVFSPD